MLASGKLMGFIPTTNYSKAREFYEGKLGFEVVGLDQFAMVMQMGGNQIRAVQLPAFTPQQGTILGWQVEEIEAVATWLLERGIETEKYSFIQDQKLGIWNAPSGDRVAWFKDPDGNVIWISAGGP